MQLKQLLPLFEITDKMSDSNVFSAIEYIGQEIHQLHLQKIIDETVSVEDFNRTLSLYSTKIDVDEVLTQVSSQQGALVDLRNDTQSHNQTILNQSSLINIIE